MMLLYVVCGIFYCFVTSHSIYFVFRTKIAISAYTVKNKMIQKRLSHGQWLSSELYYWKISGEACLQLLKVFWWCDSSPEYSLGTGSIVLPTPVFILYLTKCCHTLIRDYEGLKTLISSLEEEKLKLSEESRSVTPSLVDSRSNTPNLFASRSSTPAPETSGTITLFAFSGQQLKFEL